MLEENFFRVRFDRQTPGEKRCLRPLTEQGPGAQRGGLIVGTLGLRKASSIRPVRVKLIAKGMSYSPAHGDLAFPVSFFDQFMRQAMPTLDDRPTTTDLA